MSNLRDYQNDFVIEAEKRFGLIVTKKDAFDLATELGMRKPRWFICSKYRVGHGQFKLPNTDNTANVKKVLAAGPSENIANTTVNLNSEVENVIPFQKESSSTKENIFEQSLIPDKDPLFVKFGFAKSLTTIFKTKIFYPLLVTGLSGNGKTFMIEQIAAQTKRELIRVNVTNETDEDDLMGGFRLVNGETRYFKGPVLKAMEKGAILLVDEVDAGNPNKLLALHGPLEGNGYFIKKTGEFVKPAKGFTVVATANTKGQGSESGKFIGTNILNEAFLERFCITVEQEYPTEATEKKILSMVFASLDLDPKDTFIDSLILWANTIRKTFYEGGCSEIIATRRLVHIAKTYAIFGNRIEAITLGTNRFDDETKQSFLDLYDKCDAEAKSDDNDSDSDSDDKDSDSDGGLDKAPF